MSGTHVTTRVEKQILYVALSRAEKRNALTADMTRDLAAAVRQADARSDVRAVIVHAEGPIFSAGIDVLSLGQMRGEAGDVNPARWLRRLAADLQHALNDIEATEVPVIGALNGQVIGMGLELALCFDLRVAADDCRLSIPESRMGLVADVGGTTRLSRLVGPGRAKDMLLTARAIDAQEALSWGLVNRVVPAPQLLAAATELAEQIMKNAPLAVGLAKTIVDQGSGLDRLSQMALERMAQSQLITSEDLAEAIAAFFEKRPANFRGK
ncbi:MAG: enoyl-CoA hydratase/isomerase family protein [Pirellulales bacterium]|nr:enoyl-CoA hydratase/isomerase family protein [Pirellulales bacterium]